MTAPNPRSSRRSTYLVIGLLAVLWGYSWVAAKVATADASPLIVAAIRSSLGAAALLGYLALTRRPLRPPRFVPTALYGLLQTTGFTLAQMLAVAHGGAGKVAVLAYTMPFWLALLAWPLLGERIGRGGWAALALAALGLALIALPLDLTDLLGVAVGLVWAASAIWAKLIRARYDDDLVSLTSWQMVWGAIPLALLAALVPGRLHFTRSFVFSVAYLAIVASAVGWALWLFLLSRLPARVAGIASLATPVMGVLLAALQLHEIPGPAELAGMAAIVAALVVNSRSSAEG